MLTKHNAINRSETNCSSVPLFNRHWRGASCEAPPTGPADTLQAVQSYRARFGSVGTIVRRTLPSQGRYWKRQGGSTPRALPELAVIGSGADKGWLIGTLA